MTTTLDEGEHAILLVCRKEREYILFGLTVSSLPTPNPLLTYLLSELSFVKNAENIYLVLQAHL
jgi:hypothetical protein